MTKGRFNPEYAQWEEFFEEYLEPAYVGLLSNVRDEMLRRLGSKDAQPSLPLPDVHKESVMDGFFIESVKEWLGDARVTMSLRIEHPKRGSDADKLQWPTDTDHIVGF